MRVLVTGATGFVGSHTAAALASAGHDVRVLVRNPARVPPALDPHGVQAEVVVGDMTDEATVRSAVADCDAVVHAAAQVGVGGGGTVAEANLIGAQTVIGAAIDAGVRRIVFTSSVVVHLPTDAPMIMLDAPLSEPMSAYGATKVETERLIRRWQDDGHPITTVVLGGIYGPNAPDLINSFTAILSAVEQTMIVPPGGTTVIDVRDVALLLTRIVERETQVPRVLAGGHFIEWDDWVVALERALGQPIASQRVTTDELLALARELSAAASPHEPPALSEEAAMVMISGVPLDDHAWLTRFGVALTPLDQTFADVIAYLRTIGRLSLPEGCP
jgi:nucleoside-diphosphate-sugar epimerase